MARFSLGGDDDVGGSNLTSQPSRTKRCRTGLPPTNPATIVTTSAASTVQENDNIEELYLSEDNDDMREVNEEHNQTEGEEDLEYQTDEDGEGSEEVDDRNQGQAISGGDTMNVTSANTTGSIGTKSSMLGTFSDPDVLDCPICYEPLTIPVFQCENGHLACSSCCMKIGNKCPSCSWPIGYNRCRSIERILDSVKFLCQNLEYGCQETMLYSTREEHEKACKFAPCSCPLESCAFVGSPKKLYAHCRGIHFSSATQFDFKHPFKFWLEGKHRSVILQEKTDGTIFILNHSNNRVPRALNLICVGALHSNQEYYYELSVEYGDSTLQLNSLCATMPKWSANQPLRKYLLIPSDFVYSSGCISVAICIEKRGGS